MLGGDQVGERPVRQLGGQLEHGGTERGDQPGWLQRALGTQHDRRGYGLEVGAHRGDGVGIVMASGVFDHRLVADAEAQNEAPLGR